MQRFTLLHDGSAEGWYATYLAFHVAARLGAPLQVLHTVSENETETLDERAAHVETGARAAGVVIETRLLADFALDTLKRAITSIDGLFLPLRLMPDGETVSRFLEAFSCPLWVVSVEAQPNDMAVLVNHPLKDAHLISYAKMLSHRLAQSLVAFVLDEHFDLTLRPELSGLRWKSLPDFSTPRIDRALEQLQVGLLFLPASNVPVTESLTGNRVICPDMQDA